MMKKNILSITAFMALSFILEGQSFWQDVTISTQFAVAHHDKRLIGYSKTSQDRIINLRNPETWGTWQYGITLNKSLLKSSAIIINIGLGYGLESMNFTRRIDHCYSQKSESFCAGILISSDEYNIHFVQMPIKISFPLLLGFNAEVGILSLFDWMKVPKNNNKTIDKWREFQFYSLELNPGVGYEWNRFQLSLNYRLWQVKKIDRVLFSDRTIPSGGAGDPILTDEYEHYNPFKLWFSVGYRIGGR